MQRWHSRNTGAGLEYCARLPFGEEIPADSTVRNTVGYQASPDSQSIKFTGQYRDTETGFDFMNARYYSPAQGRFVSPDPENAGSYLADPQTFNGYSYVTNNPLTLVDPSGLGSDDGSIFGSFSSGLQDWWTAYTAPFMAYLSSYNPAVLSLDAQPNPLGVFGLPGSTKMTQIQANVANEGIQITADALSYFDVTGMGSASRSFLTGDNLGGVTTMAVLGITHGGPSPKKIPLSEAKQLFARWASDETTFRGANATQKSIIYHFTEHGADVRASNIWQYLRKADEFSKNLRGASKTILADGKERWMKDGKFVILDTKKKIVSYGLQR